MVDPSELDASVTARVPTRTDRDDRYFTDRYSTDTYQTTPLHGYTKMFEKMPGHPNIEVMNIRVMLETDYREVQGLIPCLEMIYTGPVDAFFKFCDGPPPYRLEFRHETHSQNTLQPTGTVNYLCFVGQLTTYRYDDMDHVVAQALTTYAELNGARHLAVSGSSS